MKKSCKISLSLFIFFLFLSSCIKREKIDVYKKENLAPKDSVKYKSIKIQTH